MIRMGVKKLKICPNGHQFYKSGDCPVCPICEKENNPEDGILSEIGAPARRALIGAGIETLIDLTGFTEAEVLRLHGMGPSAMRKIKSAMEKAGLKFRIG